MVEDGGFGADGVLHGLGWQSIFGLGTGLQYMATDTPTLVYMANNVRNVPTTLDALQSPDLDVTPQFQTFLDIFADPNSHYKEPSAIGAADQNTLQLFASKWEVGKETDLDAGLADAAKQIDDQLAQAAI